MRPRPVEEVLDEVEQSSVCPLQVFEDEHDRTVVGEPLEEEPPGGEEALPIVVTAVGEAEQLLQPRLEPAALCGVGHALGEHGGELRRRGRGRILFRDQRAHTDHLGERPVRDTVAVGKAAAAVPPRAR